MTNESPIRTKYTVRRTVNITEEMDLKLQQILGKQDRSVTQQDQYRTALRQYIDDQEDQIGSRRHFSKSLQNRLDLLEGKMLFFLNVIIYLLAANLAVVVQAVTKDPNTQSKVLIHTALKKALTEGPTQITQFTTVWEELSSDE